MIEAIYLGMGHNLLAGSNSLPVSEITTNTYDSKGDRPEFKSFNVWGED